MYRGRNIMVEKRCGKTWWKEIFWSCYATSVRNVKYFLVLSLTVRTSSGNRSHSQNRAYLLRWGRLYHWQDGRTLRSKLGGSPNHQVQPRNRLCLCILVGSGSMNKIIYNRMTVVLSLFAAYPKNFAIAIFVTIAKIAKRHFCYLSTFSACKLLTNTEYIDY